MGYLNKGTITVDAILTNRGRELLASSGRTGLEITQFSVSDDEIDYSLFNEAHPNGSEYAGAIIENMPVLEATPDEQQIMRYKLVSLNDTTAFGTAYVDANNQIVFPQINGSITSTVALSSTITEVTTTVTTIPKPNNVQEAYIVTVGDATLVKVYKQTKANLGTVAPVVSVQTGLVTNANVATIAANGSATFRLPPSGTAEDQKLIIERIGRVGSTLITVYGETTGATVTQTITVAS